MQQEKKALPGQDSVMIKEETLVKFVASREAKPTLK